MTHEDTRALVERARAGERAAFDELASRHRSHLAAVISQRLGATLGGEINADDVLQETLLRAFRSLDRFEWRAGDEAGAGFFRWLSGIAVRVILEAAGRTKRKASSISLDFDVADPEGVSPGRALARRERLARFEEALKCLSPDQRTVLRLVRIEGLPVKEVAAKTGRSPNAVTQLVLRALRNLRQRFPETESLGLPADGFEPPAHDREDAS